MAWLWLRKLAPFSARWRPGLRDTAAGAPTAFVPPWSLWKIEPCRRSPAWSFRTSTPTASSTPPFPEQQRPGHDRRRRGPRTGRGRRHRLQRRRRPRRRPPSRRPTARTPWRGRAAGQTYRVEFTNLPAGFSPGPHGANDGTTVQFVNGGASNVDLGLVQPATYSVNNPLLVTPQYWFGDPQDRPQRDPGRPGGACRTPAAPPSATPRPPPRPITRRRLCKPWPPSSRSAPPGA